MSYYCSKHCTEAPTKRCKGISYLLAHPVHPLPELHQQWLPANIDFNSPSETCCKVMPRKKTVAHDATSATCKHFSSKLLVDKYSKSSLGTFGTSVVLWWEISLTAPKGPSSLLRVVFPTFGWWFLRAQRR